MTETEDCFVNSFNIRPFRSIKVQLSEGRLSRSREGVQQVWFQEDASGSSPSIILIVNLSIHHPAAILAFEWKQNAAQQHNEFVRRFLLSEIKMIKSYKRSLIFVFLTLFLSLARRTSVIEILVDSIAIASPIVPLAEFSGDANKGSVEARANKCGCRRSWR